MTEELNGGCLDEREAFEAHMTAEGWNEHWMLRRSNGDYMRDFVQESWKAWQKRASLSTSKQAGAGVPPMPAMIGRRPHDDDHPNGYLESDESWSMNNPDAISWLADNHAAIRVALSAAEPEAFLRQMANLPGTVIRSSRDLDPAVIADVRASGKWLALRDGLGFAIMTEHARQVAEDEQSACAKCSSPNDCKRLGCAALAARQDAPAAGAQTVSDLMRVIDAYAFDYKEQGKLGPTRREVARAIDEALASREEAPATPQAEAGDWSIDHSAGRPILTYKNCSVIEAEDAEYVLRLIAADRAALKGEQPAHPSGTERGEV
jgi:hypothetical protein